MTTDGGYGSNCDSERTQRSPPSPERQDTAVVTCLSSLEMQSDTADMSACPDHDNGVMYVSAHCM